MTGRGNKRKRKAVDAIAKELSEQKRSSVPLLIPQPIPVTGEPKEPPTSHFEASLLNQRNPEGSVSNRPQLNDRDASPPPQRLRAILPSSETAPLSQNRGGLQDANLTSPMPRNLSLLDRIPQNTATTSSSSRDSVPQPVNPAQSSLPPSETANSSSVTAMRTPQAAFFQRMVDQLASSMQLDGAVLSLSTATTSSSSQDSIPQSLKPAQASLPTSETAPLSRNQRGLQDANLTSPPPRNLSLLDRIPQNTATTSSSSQNSIPQPVNPTVTNVPLSSLRTRRLVLTPSRRAEQPPSSFETAEVPPLCTVCFASISEYTRRYGGNVCGACLAFHKKTNNSGREFICKTGHHQCPVYKGNHSACHSCKYKRCIDSGLPAMATNQMRISERPSELERAQTAQNVVSPVEMQTPAAVPTSSPSPSQASATSQKPHPMSSSPPPSTSGTAEPEVVPICKVCSASSEYIRSHGGKVCRACLEFHRRINDKKMVYQCKTGRFQCPVSKGTNSACNRCRYQRCIDAGLPAMATNEMQERLSDLETARDLVSPVEVQTLAAVPTSSPSPLPSEANATSSPSPLTAGTTEPEYSLICAVCRDRNSEFVKRHGTKVCRTCSDFHRRTNEKNMVYRCKTGIHQCPVSKGTQRACNSCKYQKCLDAGLSAMATKDKPSDAVPLETLAPLPPPLLNPRTSPEGSPICEVCGFRGKRSPVEKACLRCYYFYRRIKSKKTVRPCATGANRCTIVKGSYPCQSCRYKKCLAVGMPAIEMIEAERPGTPPSTPPQSSSTVAQEAEDEELPRCWEQVPRAQGGNRAPREDQTADLPRPSRKIFVSEAFGLLSSRRSAPGRSAGSPAMDTDENPEPLFCSELLRDSFLWAKPILLEAGLTEPQMRQIFRTQWPMLLILASFEKPTVHEYHEEFKDGFQKWQVSAEECDHLKKIALFMKPKEPCEHTFQRQLDDQILALNTLCELNKSPSTRSGNLLLWLSDIKHSAPNIQIYISVEDLATIIDDIFG